MNATSRTHLLGAVWLLLLAWAGGAAGARDLLHGELPPLPAGWQAAPDGLTARVAASSQRLALPGLSLPQAAGSLKLRWLQTAGKPGEIRAGVVFGGVQADSGWFVLLRGDGLYWFGRLASGRMEVRLAGALAPAPAGQPSSLELTTSADRLNLLLNGTPLSLPFDGSHAGSTALWVSGTGTLLFSRVEDGREAAPAPLIPPAVPTTPGGATPAPGTHVPDPLEHTGSATAPGTTPPIPAVPVDPPIKPTTPTTPPTTPVAPVEPVNPTAPTVPTTPPTTPVVPAVPVDPPTTPTVPTTPPTTPVVPATPVEPPTTPVTPPTTPAVPTTPVTPPTTPAVPTTPVTPPTTPAVPPTTPAVPTAPVTPPTPPAVPATPERPVLFSENFDPPKHNWNHDDYRSVDQGGLRLRSDAGYQLSGFPYEFGDVRYSGRVRAISASGGTYGLVARLQRDGGSGYVLVLRDPDTFAIARVDQGKSTLLTKGACVLGKGDHTLVATLVGSKISLAVDGVTVGSTEDTAYASGGIGVWVDNRREALFDDLLATTARPEDLVLAATPAAPTTPPTTPPTAPPAAPRQVLFEERFAAPKMSWQQDAQRQLRDGALHLKADDGRFTVSGVAGAQYGDYRATLEGERVDGPDTGRWGLLVRLQPDGRCGYLLAFTPDGSFSVLRLDTNGAEQLGRGATTLGPGSHRLWGRCSGGSLVFGLDETELIKVQDATYATGGFGGYVDNGTHARLGELTAEALP